MGAAVSSSAGPTGAGGAATGPSSGPATTSSGPGTTSSGTTTTTTTTTTSAGAGGSPATATSSAGVGGAATTTSGAGGAGGSPYDTPPTCTSMTMAVAGNNANMKPGSACKSCHVLLGAASGKTFDVGGTVYATAHEPDDCNGVNVSGAVVVITDANNMETSLPVDAVGNFFHYDLFGFAALPPPLHARVEYNGKVRKMLTSMTTGDCDSCHTETGAMSAPGRIMLP